jgi:hypothetical protein
MRRGYQAYGRYLVCLGAALAATGPLRAETAKTPYPAMAPIGQYLSASQADEIALARSAAPASISANAEVLALGDHGYESAAPGKNGFVCIVERSWANDISDKEFWNPKTRAPICFNAASVRSVLPTYLERTKWVLAGVSTADMLMRTQAEIASGAIKGPEVGSMCYMMSKDSYLNDDAGGHWHPHLMFYLPRTDASAWGANLAGSPVLGGGKDGLEPFSLYFVVVPKWSDGTPVMAMK